MLMATVYQPTGALLIVTNSQFGEFSLGSNRLLPPLVISEILVITTKQFGSECVLSGQRLDDTEFLVLLHLDAVG